MIATLKTEPAETTKRPLRVALGELEPMGSVVTAAPQAGPPPAVERDRGPYRVVLCCSRDHEED